MTQDPNSIETEQTKAIRALTDEVRRLNEHRFIRVQNSLWRLIFFQLARGLAFGLGTLLGATVLVSLIAWWASQFSFIPVLGEWLNELVRQMEAGR